MPELFHGKPSIDPFDQMESLGDEYGDEPADKTEHHVQRELPKSRIAVGGNVEQRTRAEQQDVHAGGKARRHDERHEGTRRELEQQ